MILNDLLAHFAQPRVFLQIQKLFHYQRSGSAVNLRKNYRFVIQCDTHKLCMATKQPEEELHHEDFLHWTVNSLKDFLELRGLKQSG